MNNSKQKDHSLQSMHFEEPTTQSHEELEPSKSLEESNDPIGYEDNHYAQEQLRYKYMGARF